MRDNTLSSIGYRTATLDELKDVTPAAFSRTYDPARSDRYSFVPTDELVKVLLDTGWNLFSAKQNGGSPFSRHVIRFDNPKLGYFDMKGDNVKPQVILDNSHNGTSPAQLHMGLFRLVCTNGLIVAMPGMYTNLRLRHVGIDKAELIRALELVSDQYTLVASHIKDMTDVKMNEDARHEFALKAVAIREPHSFINDDGTINEKKVMESTNLAEIVSPIRGEDRADNLWSVFNVVQERMVKGGYERVSFGKNRRSTTRGITNAARNIEYNRSLWTVAESYMETA